MSDYEHFHKFFAFQAKSTFEPTGDVNELGQALYIMVDYMHLFCNCGEAIKKLEAVKHNS